MPRPPFQPGNTNASDDQEQNNAGDLHALETELRLAFGKGRYDSLRTRIKSGNSADETEKREIPAPAPGERIGDFEILTELGRGGMGVIYRAKQVSLNRVVALKLLQAEFSRDPERVLRFRNECKAVAKLSHPNIVPIYAQGQEGMNLYYAMELVEGESLDRIIARQPIFSSRHQQEQINRKWAARFAEVAQALNHAHRHAVLHRDLKPANLVMDRDGHLHILDFGVARITDKPGVTVTGQILGTPAYLSPEQAGAPGNDDSQPVSKRRSTKLNRQGGNGDYRSDIYALGVTIFETVTGKLPFQAEGLAELLRKIAEEHPPAPRKLNPAVSRDMEAVILKAMHKNPDKRYQYAAEMALDLENIAAGLPISTRPPGIWEKTVREVKTHQGLFTLMFAGLIVCVILLLTSHYLPILAGGAAVIIIATRLRLSRRKEANRLVAEAMDLLLHESYLDLDPVTPLLSRARRLGCNTTDFRICEAITRIGPSPEVAETELKRIAESERDNRIVLYLLSWINRLKGNREATENWLKLGDEASGTMTPEHYFLRGIAVLQTHIDQAIENFRQAISMRPDFTQALLHLGRALNQWIYHNRRLDHVREQTMCLESLCLLRPNRAYPRYLLSLAYRLAAETHEMQAAGADEQMQQEHELQARLLFAKAYEAAKEAQTIEPTSGRGYAAEAEYFERTGDYHAAIAAWDNAGRFESYLQTRVEVHQYRFRLEWWTGQLDRAMWDLDALELIASEDAVLSILYPALILAEWGRKRQAEEHLAAAWEQSFTAENSEKLKVIRAARALVEGLKEPDQPLVDFDSTEFSLNDKTPGDLFFAGLQELIADSRDNALCWFNAAAATFDNEEYCFHGRAVEQKILISGRYPDW